MKAQLHVLWACPHILATRSPPQVAESRAKRGLVSFRVASPFVADPLTASLALGGCPCSAPCFTCTRWHCTASSSYRPGGADVVPDVEVLRADPMVVGN